MDEPKPAANAGTAAERYKVRKVRNGGWYVWDTRNSVDVAGPFKTEKAAKEKRQELIKRS